MLGWPLWSGGPAFALTLEEAVAIAVESNPEIGQAIENREAIQFELRQARGLFLPSVDLEASVGVRRLDNPARRALGIEDDPLYPSEVGVTVTQKLFDGFETRSEVERQASRVDGASFRVLERSEFIALQVAREYFETLLQQRIVAIARQNAAFHQGILGDIRAVAREGSLTEADAQQAQERSLAAHARVEETEEELAAAKIRFNRLVAMPIGATSMPATLAGYLPRSLDEAIGLARVNNPRIKISGADIDAAAALVEKARSDYYPKVTLEGRGRVGEDVDGTEDRTTDLQGRLVLRWNIFRGGITSANEQEQIRRVSEERLKLHQSMREVEEAVRISWDRRVRQRGIAQTYGQQLGANRQLVSSYREQFKVGRRSLLDVLDAQNTLFSVSVLRETATYAALFADYRLLAATGRLLLALGASAPTQAMATARDDAGVPPTPPAETYRRVPPPAGSSPVADWRVHGNAFAAFTAPGQEELAGLTRAPAQSLSLGFSSSPAQTPDPAAFTGPAIGALDLFDFRNGATEQ
jgi:adhesin transport system outer membrane protein